MANPSPSDFLSQAKLIQAIKDRHQQALDELVQTLPLAKASGYQGLQQMLDRILAINEDIVTLGHVIDLIHGTRLAEEAHKHLSPLSGERVTAAAKIATMRMELTHLLTKEGPLYNVEQLIKAITEIFMRNV